MTGQGALQLVPAPAVAGAPTVVQVRLQRLQPLLETGWRPGEWDHESKVFVPDPSHQLVIGGRCAVVDCGNRTEDRASRLCLVCKHRWLAKAMPELATWVSVPRPVPSRRQRWELSCAVEGCPREGRGTKGLCDAHRETWTRREQEGVAFEAFLRSAHPMPDLGPCVVAACVRPALRSHLRLCPTHYDRWRRQGRPERSAFEDWTLCAPQLPDGTVLILRGLRPLTFAEFVYGLQARDRAQVKTDFGIATTVVNTLRAQQVDSILDADLEALSKAARQLGRWIGNHVRLAYTDVEDERRKLVQDARVFGHREGMKWNFARISQPWLREAVQTWAHTTQTRVTARHVATCLHAVGLLSAWLARRDDGGNDPRAVGRGDIDGFAAALRVDLGRGKISAYARRNALDIVRRILSECRELGLLRDVDTGFAVAKAHVPAIDEMEETPAKSLPESVVRHLSSPESLAALSAVPAPYGVLGDHAGPQAVLMFEILRDTGRRPNEIVRLRVDAAQRDSDGKPILVWDNYKRRRYGRRLPIGEDLYAKLVAEREWVLRRFPDTPHERLPLFPRTTMNADGTQPMPTARLTRLFRSWLLRLGDIDGPQRRADGSPEPFPLKKITPYVFRHTYAQRHADAGTPVDVLRELMDHTNIKSTQAYYRVSMKRKRSATERLASMRRNSAGEPAARPAAASTVRDAVAEVAVPFGRCSEPSNVKAGGQQCPIRYRCAGCDFFETDPSFLPDLKAHVDELLRAREHGEALGAPDWSLVPKEEIARLRTLIRSLEHDLANLPDDERAVVERACVDLRKARQAIPVSIGKRAS